MGRLLYVTPVLPSLTGNGLAMRAGSVLRALGAAPLGPPACAPGLRALGRRARPGACVTVRRRDRGRGDRAAGRARRPARLPARGAAVRAAVCRGRTSRGPGRHRAPDLPPDRRAPPAERRRRRSGRDGRRGGPVRAAARRGARGLGPAVRLLRTRPGAPRRGHRASASERGRDTAAARAPSRVVHVPVRRQPRLLPERRCGALVREGGASRICSACAGGVPGPRRRQREAPPELAHAGAVRDLGPCYAAADVAIVPLRAGGGTRIKILEAFAHGVPVVSTPVGAEGLEAGDGEHLLLGEDAEAFARRCAELMASPELRRNLAERALRLVRDSYSLDAAIAAVAPGEPRAR